MSFNLPPRKTLLTIAAVVAFLGFYTIFAVYLISHIHDEQAKQDPKQVSEVSGTKYLAAAQPSDHALVEEKVVAEKLDLQRKLISARNPSQVASISSIIRRQGGEVLKSGREYIVADIPKEHETEITKALKQSNTVEQVEVDYPTHVSAESPGWGVSRIDAPDVWDTTSASGIIIAVIDTGIDYSHPDLKGRYAGGYDTVNEDNDPRDDHGHGTHVSGIIAADLDGSGVVGVAPQGQLLGVKALAGDGTGYISDLVEAIDYAIQNKAQIINYSLGTSYNSSLLEDKINEASRMGIIQVAAAGNNNGGSLLYPAAYGAVIAVAATDSNDQLASFSALGAELSAPGVGITSTVPGGGYATWSGTSMAAPHVTATAALMIANHQTNVRQQLQNTAIDLGTKGKDSYFGYGLVHAKPAALGEDTLAPLITFLSPEHSTTVNGTVQVQVDIQDEYKIASASMSINNMKVTEWKEEPYSYRWNTDTLTDGAYTLLVKATDENGNTGEAQIGVTVADATSTPTPTMISIPSRQQGESEDVRQDTIQEQAQQHRQDYNNVPQSPQESHSQSPSQSESQGSAPAVTNLNERHQKPELPPEAVEKRNKDVQGIATVSWWELVKEKIFALFH